MPDNADQNTIVNQVRRGTLLSGIALLAVYVSAPASFACGGGGDGGEQNDQSSTTKKKPKTKKEKQSTVTMSQNKFINLSDSELSKFNPRIKYGGRWIKISGFSPSTSGLLMWTAMHARKSTQRLVKDMAKIKGEKARKAHLQKELKRTEKLEKLLAKEKKDLKKRKDPKQASKEETNKFFKKLFNKNKESKEPETEIDKKLTSLEYYSAFVSNWSRRPMEGTLK